MRLADAIEDFSAKKLAAFGKTAAGVTERLYSWPRVFEELFCIIARFAQTTPILDGERRP